LVLHTCYENNYSLTISHTHTLFEVKYNGHMSNQSTFAPIY